MSTVTWYPSTDTGTGGVGDVLCHGYGMGGGLAGEVNGNPTWFTIMSMSDGIGDLGGYGYGDGFASGECGAFCECDASV